MNALRSGAESATKYQVTNVRIAMPMIVGTNTALTRSASRWIGAREPWASRISLTICDSTLSAPTVVAR